MNRARSNELFREQVEIGPTRMQHSAKEDIENAPKWSLNVPMGVAYKQDGRVTLTTIVGTSAMSRTAQTFDVLLISSNARAGIVFLDDLSVTGIGTVSITRTSPTVLQSIHQFLVLLIVSLVTMEFASVQTGNATVSRVYKPDDFLKTKYGFFLSADDDCGKITTLSDHIMEY